MVRALRDRSKKQNAPSQRINGIIRCHSNQNPVDYLRDFFLRNEWGVFLPMGLASFQAKVLLW